MVELSTIRVVHGVFDGAQDEVTCSYPALLLQLFRRHRLDDHEQFGLQVRPRYKQTLGFLQVCNKTHEMLLATSKYRK